MPKPKTKPTNTRQEKPNEASLGHVVELMGSALFADKQRALVSGLIDYSDAVDASTNSLKESGRENEAEATEAVTKFLRNNADILATTNPDQALEKIREIARDHPTLFTCGAIAAGAAAVWWVTAENEGVLDSKSATNDAEAS